MTVADFILMSIETWRINSLDQDHVSCLVTFTYTKHQSVT
jgi:hypothetical protein